MAGFGKDNLAEYHRVQNIRTNSGELASTWRSRGEHAGKLMRKHLKKGDCVECPRFHKKVPSHKSEAEFIATWGESSESIREVKCNADPDDFFNDCPKED